MLSIILIWLLLTTCASRNPHGGNYIHATRDHLLFVLSMIFASKNHSSKGFMFVYTF